MSTNLELMGQEIYDLLYNHCDIPGKDIEDVFYCEEEHIPQDRVIKLEALLLPFNDVKHALIPLEAAKLLAAWGSVKAIDFFEYCIDNRIDHLGNLSPHRLYGYDVTYEEFERGIFHYYARCIDKSTVKGEGARIRIYSILKKIIQLTKELKYDMTNLISDIKDADLREYEPDLKACFTDFINRDENDLNRRFNLNDLQALLVQWDSNFITEIDRVRP